jgi:hypothetical protein
VLSMPRLYNENVRRLVQKSTESRTTETGIGELGRVLETRQSKVIEEEITRLHIDLKCYKSVSRKWITCPSDLRSE